MDYLKITHEKNVTVGKYCGELTGKEVVITGDFAVITFHSNYRVQKRGFRIFFTAVQPSKCNDNGISNLTKIKEIPVEL